MDLKLKAKFDTLRIEALENEITRLKESYEFSIQLQNEIIQDKNDIIANKEGRFISSQNTNRDLRADVAHYQSELEAFKDRAQVQLDIDREKLRISRMHVQNRDEQIAGTEKALDIYKEKARLAREDAQYWANEAAKFEINCNNCNL